MDGRPGGRAQAAQGLRELAGRSACGQLACPLVCQNGGSCAVLSDGEIETQGGWWIIRAFKYVIDHSDQSDHRLVVQDVLRALHLSQRICNVYIIHQRNHHLK